MKINVYSFKLKLYKYRKVLSVKLRFKPVIQLIFISQFYAILVEKLDS